MANPIDNIRKLKGRSFREIRTRGGQMFSAYKEQIGLSGGLPSAEEFLELIDAAHFPETEITKENLLNDFIRNGQSRFFASLKNTDDVEKILRSIDEKSIAETVEKAAKIVEGKFDLLGYKNLELGRIPDWQQDPISGKSAAIKHWKLYDELGTAETGDKKISWELNRHQYFFTLGKAYLLTKDEVFAETFFAHLEDWTKKNPPGSGINWISSLEVAFRLISWIWAFRLFKDSEYLTADIFQNALNFLYAHGRHIETYLSTYYSPNTHLTGEALGLYYLGTQFPFFKRAAYWRETGRDILLAELDRQFLSDGVYFEQSAWYQRYTIDFYTQFLILAAINGEEINLPLREKLETTLKKSLDFMAYITRPDGTTPLIGDDDGGCALPHGNLISNDFRHVLSTGAVLFGNAEYKYIADKFAEETFWLLGREASETFEKIESRMPETKAEGFPAGGYFVTRDGFTETDNYLLVDCGNIGGLAGGHSHADTLAIEAAVGGKPVLIDPGTYTYHESGELRNRFRTTEKHNTLTINDLPSSAPGGKFGWETSAEAELLSWTDENRFAFFEGSHDGYKRLANPAIHRRSILFLKNDYWIIRDFVETHGENDFSLSFQFSADVQPQITASPATGARIDASFENGFGLRVITFGDNGVWQKKDDWVSDCFGRREKASLMQFKSRGAGSQEFFTFLFPTDFNLSAPSVFETPLDSGRAFVIKHRGYNDLFVFADNAEIPVKTEFFDLNFRFLWARLIEDKGMPEEFVLIDGAKFSINGREIINCPKKIAFATARVWSNKVNVKTAESVFSVSLPKPARPISE